MSFRLAFLIALAFSLNAQERPAPPKAANALEDFSDNVERLVRQVNPAVLQIVTETYGAREEEAGSSSNTVARQLGVGTGVVVSPDGYVLTNAHVVLGARRVRVRRNDTGATGRPTRMISVEAEIAGIDRETDLALLKLPSGKVWSSLRLGDSSQLRQGQVVFAVGNPRGLENSVSMGVVSAVARQLDPDSALSFIQTDAPINPGNSGGPLLNAKGEVVGINTFIFTQSGGSEGLGFAIPSNFVRDIYSQLRKYGRVRRGEIGLVLRSVTPAIAAALGLQREEGILIEDVVAGKAANEAGLKIDDIVSRVEGRPVRNVRQFVSNLFRTEIGGKLTMEVHRGDQVLTVKVAVGELDDAAERFSELVRAASVPVPKLGILAVPLDPSTAAVIAEPRYKFGIIVTAKLQTVAAFREELQAGDVIYSINGKQTGVMDTLRSVLDGVDENGPLVVQVQRDRRLRYLVLRGE